MIINIAAGTYEENVPIDHFVGGISQYLSINIIGAGQDKTFIQGSFTVHSNVPTHISNLHISKGGTTGMAGAYYCTTVWENVTFEGNGMMNQARPSLMLLGGRTFLNGVVFNNAPSCAIQASGIVFINGLAGTANAIGIWISISPGYQGLAVVSSIPSGFATTKIYKPYGSPIVFEGGALA